MIYNGNIAPKVLTSEYNSCTNTCHVLANLRIGQANIDASDDVCLSVWSILPFG